MIIYFNGEFLSKEDVKISPFDRGFQFADGIYEVIRFDIDGFFEFDEHIKRMKNGIKELKINFDDFNGLQNISDKLIEKNCFAGKRALLYYQITRGVSFPRNHSYPKDIRPTVFISASPLTTNKFDILNGIKIILEKDLRWQRCDIKTISLLYPVLAQQKAKELGAKEVVLIRDNYVTEGSHTNFCCVKDGEVYTPALSNYILPGITRKVILRICVELDITVHEENIKRDDLFDMDECFIIGTTTEITPVVRIDDFIIGEGIPGKITRSLQNELDKLLKY